jgi:iron(III) transport system permease protein
MTVSRPLVAVAAVVALAVLPLVVLAVVALGAGPSDSGGETALWGHLLATVLPGAGLTTALLMAGVGLLAGTVGVATAWLVTACRFPGRDLLQWALVLPLSIPTYIVAYVHVEVMDFTGPLQTALRALGGWHSARDYWFPAPRSLPGAVFVMASVLYPYVYLSARAMFLSQAGATLEAARLLGAPASRVFFRVALPLARPAIIVGVTLALMECVNDIGAVEYLGVRTLTFSIYDTWLNRGDLAGAAQLAVAMLALVVALLEVERWSRQRQRFDAGRARSRPFSPYRLAGGRALAAAAACAAPVVVGFVVPVAVLGRYALNRLDVFAEPAMQRALLATAGLAGAAALVTVALGFVLAAAGRIGAGRLTRRLVRVASVGYAVPGTVLAVGVLVAVGRVDNWIHAAALAVFGSGTGLLLMSSGTALVYAYAVRFLAIGFGTVEAGFQRIGPHLDMAARTLGRGTGRMLAEIHLPLLRGPLLTAALMVFVDATKELPATLLLRPFGLETLATLVYVEASREAVNDAAPAALVIILVGLVPVVAVSRLTGRASRSARTTGRRGGGSPTGSSTGSFGEAPAGTLGGSLAGSLGGAGGGLGTD